MAMMDDKGKKVPKAPMKSSTYTIKKGDNFWKLAEKNKPKGMTTAQYWTKVVNANKGKIKSGNPDLIYPGEKIILPGVGSKPTPKPTPKPKPAPKPMPKPPAKPDKRISQDYVGGVYNLNADGTQPKRPIKSKPKPTPKPKQGKERKVNPYSY